MRLTRLVPLLLCSTAVLASPLRLPQFALTRLSASQHSESQQVLGNTAGSGVAGAATPVSGHVGKRKLHGKFLHITDFHPDEFYKAHSSTLEENACHSGHGPAGIYGAETSDCDSPYSLVNATFDWIRDNIRDEIDFVIWTGDSARHDSDESIPRSPAQVQASNEFIANKFIDLLDYPSGQGLRVPVIPTLGNNDILPHNVLLPGPNKWLKRYTEIWNRFIPQEQRHSFEFGGWFYVEVIPNKLAVFSLNSLYFFDRNAGVDDCVNPAEPGFKQLEWLRIQLEFMRERGIKAILMGHVPPARTDSKRLWDETCWQKYTLWLRQYRDVIVSGLYGHMNIDHFMLQDAKDLDYRLLGSEAFMEEDDDDDDDDDRLAADAPQTIVRTAMETELDIRSTADYLLELRSSWTNLPKPVAAAQSAQSEVDAQKKGRKGRKGRKGGKGKKGKDGKPKLSKKWSERFQLSIVAPSIVPNYLPSLRVMEYNISGIEDAPVWTDTPMSVFGDGGDGAAETQKKKSKHKGKGKKGKGKDPNLVIPDGPSKTAGPGPAYSPQTLTLLGYTQYFANLTYINNDMTPDEDEDNVGHNSIDSIDAQKWREGKHGDKQPKKGKPRKFQFEVEYSTFTDKIYGLTDMTVNSFLDMAYRMGRRAKAGDVDVDVGDGDVDVDDVVDVVVTDDVAATDPPVVNTPMTNKVWLHFLRHAFVSSVSPEELEQLGP